ncbi:MAG TPA: flagellar protein FliT [Gallionellaceae bacterium]|nr:flagellar protein FliT [Gallionellaceae bacterium]
MSAVIENYQRLSGIMGKMREAAALGEWDHLVELEQECSQHVAVLKQQDNVPADEATRKQKADLIRKILADDAAIRSKTEPWMAQLQRIMQSARTEQQLLQAYSE